MREPEEEGQTQAARKPEAGRRRRFLPDFIAALKREMTAAGQSVTRLGVSWKRGVATLPLHGKQRFEIRREHVVSKGDTPEEMAAAVYAEYLHVRSGAEDA